MNFFRRGLRRHLRRTLVVHTKDGRSLRGVLTHQHADCVVLSQVRFLDADVALGGEVVILLGNVSWCQDVTGMDRKVEELPSSFTLAAGERP